MRIFLLMFLAALLSGCGYNSIQQKDEAVKAGWSEVLNQYKRCLLYTSPSPRDS